MDRGRIGAGTVHRDLELGGGGHHGITRHARLDQLHVVVGVEETAHRVLHRALHVAPPLGREVGLDRGDLLGRLALERVEDGVLVGADDLGHAGADVGGGLGGGLVLLGGERLVALA